MISGTAPVDREITGVLIKFLTIGWYRQQQPPKSINACRRTGQDNKPKPKANYFDICNRNTPDLVQVDSNDVIAAWHRWLVA